MARVFAQQPGGRHGGTAESVPPIFDPRFPDIRSYFVAFWIAGGVITAWVLRPPWEAVVQLVGGADTEPGQDFGQCTPIDPKVHAFTFVNPVESCEEISR